MADGDYYQNIPGELYKTARLDIRLINLMPRKRELEQQDGSVL
jgi:hypothetical protein